MIRDVFLDVDDTILDFGRAEREALASALSQMGVGVTDARIQKYHEVNLAHWQMLERGEITRERLLVRRFEKFFESVGVFANAEKTQHVYEYELGRRSYFLEGAEALLETNFSRLQRHHRGAGTKNQGIGLGSHLPRHLFVRGDRMRQAAKGIF